MYQMLKKYQFLEKYIIVNGQFFIFGLLALVLFLYSLNLRKRKKYAAGLVVGVLELLSGTMSCLDWMWMLLNSGKSDWYLLGIHRYTPFALVFYAMMGAGVLCVVLNFCGLLASFRETHPAPKSEKG